MIFRRKNFVHPRWGVCWSSDTRSMPHVFSELADYNRRCSQGIRHTIPYSMRMAELQAEFDEWSAEIQPSLAWSPAYTRIEEPN